MQARVATDVGDAEVRLGAYRIVRRIAAGGMGTIYLAHRESWTKDFTKPVALKVMHPHLAREPSFVRMFLDEARVAIQIEHPHVCNVIEVGVANGSHFLVMEYLNGKTLGQIVKEIDASGPSKTTSRDFYETYQHYAARIIADAADGLHAAHEAKSQEGVPLEIVHRDVSPHNIMVTYAGAVKVVDFGIAHAKERLEQTESGLVKGKLKYASPEQISGRGVDKRTDVWSLGVCLWEAVTLQHPFGQTDQAEVVAAITTRRLPSPRELAPWLHPELETILLRALSLDPAARFATAKDMSAALRAFLFNARTMVEAAELGDWLDALSPASAAGAPQAPVDAAELSPSGAVILEPDTAAFNTRDVTQNERTGDARAVPMPTPRPPIAWAVASAAAIALLAATLMISRSDAHEVTPPPAPASEAPVAVQPAPEVEAVAEAAPVEPPAVARDELEKLALDPTPMPAAPPTRREARPTPAAPRPTPVPAVDAPSALAVSASGGTVRVWVDGAMRGLSPLRVDLPAGQHSVRLVDLTTGESSEQTLSFTSGHERTMRVDLAR